MHLKTYTNQRQIPSNINPVRDSLSQSDFDLLVAQYKQAFYDRATRDHSLSASGKHMKSA